MDQIAAAVLAGQESAPAAIATTSTSTGRHPEPGTTLYVDPAHIDTNPANNGRGLSLAKVKDMAAAGLRTAH